jgi:pimeloyl-ACP methyl ester carboxylesterase
MRSIFLKVIAEDLSDAARKIQCPVGLVYGADDKETPPELGERLAQLINRAELSVLPGHNHYSLLDSGRHLVLKRLTSFAGHLR